MSDKELKGPSNDPRREDKEPVVLRNENGEAVDPAVVVDEPGRTVLLTDDETIIFEKQPQIDIAPKKRQRKVYRGMWGPIEIGILGAGMLSILAALALYFFFVAPSTRELEAGRARVERLEAELGSARSKFGNIANDENRVARLISSVNDFESSYLPVPNVGRTGLYQRINGLIATHGLINSSGPDYAPLEIIDRSGNGGSDDTTGKAKYRSFFPGVYVTMTVEGTYTGLRRFLRDIETGGNEFIVVSSVQLEPSDSQSAPDQSGATTAQAGQPPLGPDPTTMYPAAGNTSIPRDQFSQAAMPNSAKGKTHGAVVSLRIEMASYFRRPGSSTFETASVTQ
ncbi:MAG: hypothetical protein AB7Q37_01330 [Pyrinomonadaceae bacterium]